MIVSGAVVDAASALTATMPMVALARRASPTRRPGSDSEIAQHLDAGRPAGDGVHHGQHRERQVEDQPAGDRPPVDEGEHGHGDRHHGLRRRGPTARTAG